MLDQVVLDALAQTPSASLAELAERAKPQRPESVFNTLAKLALQGKIRVVESVRDNGRPEFRFALPEGGA